MSFYKTFKSIEFADKENIYEATFNECGYADEETMLDDGMIAKTKAEAMELSSFADITGYAYKGSPVYKLPVRVKSELLKLLVKQTLGGA